jgi:S1-C subfamily serine protease
MRTTWLAGAAAAALTVLAVPAARTVQAEEGSGADRARAVAVAVQQEIRAAVEQASPAFVVVSGGSGVVISPDGWALTNHHVIAGHEVGERWWVRMDGDKPYIAQLIGTDPRGDIAVLKLESEEPLPYVELGNSDAVRIGDLTFALGNPFGFADDAEPTVSVGIVSANHLNRGGYSDAIQTDAPLNPGNSGGPLLNLRGELIGINGRIAVRFGNRQNTGIGYAIPTNQIRRFLPALQKGGIVYHGRMGGLRLRSAEPRGTGVVVTRVSDGSAAQSAGLRRGDRIVQVDGMPVSGATRFQGLVGAYPAGARLTLGVERDDAEIELVATLQAPPEADEAAEPGFLGVRLGSTSEDSEVRGVEVSEVIEGGPAEKAGLRAGDRILTFNGTEVRTGRELANVVRSLSAGTRVEIDVERGGEALTLTAVLSKR